MTMQEHARKPNKFGIAAMAAAAIALFVAVTHMVAGPIAPQEPIEQSIVDMAVKIKEAAERAATGAPAPAPEKTSFDIDQTITVAYLALAGVAMALALIGLFKDKGHAPAYIGFSLGGVVLLMTWLQWVALIIGGVIIIAAIIYSLSDILSF